MLSELDIVLLMLIAPKSKLRFVSKLGLCS